MVVRPLLLHVCGGFLAQIRLTAYRVIIAGYKKAIQTTTNAKIINKVIILDIS